MSTIAPARTMPDGSPCWCVSGHDSSDPAVWEGWQHAPTCLLRRAGGDVEALVDAALADSMLVAELVEYPLDLFWQRKVLWAANYFVLWPLGLTLVVVVDTHPVDAAAWCGDEERHEAHAFRPASNDDLRRPPEGACAGTAVGEVVTDLQVRHWQFPDGQLGETIDAPEENDEDYSTFLRYVHDRMLELKPHERRYLLQRYARHNIASAEQVLTTVVVDE